MPTNSHTVPDKLKEEEAKPPLSPVDIVVGIASYNNARTISHVVRAVDAGIGKYFPQERSLIINSDGGSTDNTQEIVLNTWVDHKAAFLSQKQLPVNRITLPYHGIPGKGSALRTVFQMADSLGAKACCVVDADLRSITPEWIELLLAPVLHEGYDLVAPLYSRHKYDGTITNSIVYPLTRTLYGKKIRQPIGGEFGFSRKMIDYYLKQDVWDTDIARFGIDIWITTEAVAGGFQVCQSYLGAKIHDPKDPGSDLKDMFVQVVGSLMSLTDKHYDIWKDVKGSSDVPVFGFKYLVGVLPVKVKIENMLKSFSIGVNNLIDVWSIFLSKETVNTIVRISREEQANFYFPKEVWVRIIYDYLLAYHHKKLPFEHLIKSLIPLYYGRTASFFMEVAEKSDDEAEDAIEDICREYEDQKNYLTGHW